VVIGSNSFSGAHFVDYVLRDNPDAYVIGMSRSDEPSPCFLPYKKVEGDRFLFHRMDLNADLDRIVKVIKENQPDYIVNFAAQSMVGQSWQEPEQWFNTNCISLMKLAKSIAGLGWLKRYVQISSPEVYGSSGGETEDEVRYNPSTPYAASKACGDMAMYPYFLHKGLPLVYTRATNVYGPYQQLYRIIPRTVLFVKQGKKLQLHGGGTAVKSYIHMRDVCDATLRIAREGKSGEVYHISPDGKGISIYELVKLIITKMGKRFEDCIEVVGERLGQDAAYVINSEKVRNELGWRPKISLDEGIEEVIAWVEEFYDDLIRESTEYIHKP
jgi:dTDP-glucose 4,6-dehydratase